MQIWNNNKCQCECKNLRKIVCKKSYVWNPATCSCENGRYAGRIIDNSVITWDKIIEMTKSIMTKIAPAKKHSNKF